MPCCKSNGSISVIRLNFEPSLPKKKKKKKMKWAFLNFQVKEKKKCVPSLNRRKNFLEAFKTCIVLGGHFFFHSFSYSIWTDFFEGVSTLWDKGHLLILKLKGTLKRTQLLPVTLPGSEGVWTRWLLLWHGTLPNFEPSDWWPEGAEIVHDRRGRMGGAKGCSWASASFRFPCWEH